MRFETRFRCPECGSYRYGSHVGGEPRGWIRSCNGHVFFALQSGDLRIRSCTFSWPDSDDYKHFVKVGIFESAEEFNKQGFKGE